MKKPPLVVYLDTQDYIRLFNEPEDGIAHQTLAKLIEYRDRNEIVIGYSWAILLEFITKPTDKFREERVRRGQLVKDICGQNAFPFITDLHRGVEFPNRGYWITGRNGQLMKASWFRGEMERQYLALLKEQGGLNRSQRRNLKRPQAMRQLLRENTSSWGTKREHFDGIPVSDEFIQSGIVLRFLKGRCSDREFEEKINLWFCDPAEFSRIMYDYADKPNLLNEFFGRNIEKHMASLQKLQECIREMDKFDRVQLEHRRWMIEQGFEKRKARQLTKPLKRPDLDPSEIVKMIEQRIGVGRAEHIGHYMLRAARKDYRALPSDFIGILQMCYVQDCDLFRCDKAMADLFRDFEPFKGKLVSRFVDLPRRIEEELASRYARSILSDAIHNIR